jgi:hypothetical protein
LGFPVFRDRISHFYNQIRLLMNKTPILFVMIFLAISYLAAEDWTVLVYMAADNDLSAQAELNIQQMEEALQPQGLNLIVQADFEGSSAKRYRITHHPQPGIGSPVVQNLGTIDSGDPATLQSFVNWGFNRYPSTRKMLIIWSHADSWYNKNKYIAPDLDTGNAIGVANGELGGALANSPHLDILLFDACSMQSIEIAYELRHYADYIVGSADLVPVKGFPYAAMIPLFDLSPSAIAQSIPELYTDSYQPNTPNNPSYFYLTTTCSALQTSELDAFYSEFSDMLPGLFAHAEGLMELRAELYEMNSGYADVDLNQLLHRMIQHGIQTEQSKNLINRLDRLIVASSYTMNWPEADLKSLALWFPDVRANLENAWEVYVSLSFARNGWLSVINAAIGDDNSPPQTPQLIRQSQRHGSLRLNIQSPLDMDSLYYHLQSDHAEYLIHPSAYAAEFFTSFAIDSGGTYQLYAIDRAGNRSLPLIGQYNYEAPQPSLVVRPNPSRRNSPSFLDWYAHDPQSEIFSLRIYNIRGQQVLSHDFSAASQQIGSLRLDTMPGYKALARGVYFIELKSVNFKLRGKLALL